MIHFVVTAAQEHSIRDYLALRGKSLAGRIEVLHYEDLPDRERFERGTYILTALEYLNPSMLSLVTAIHARLAGVEGFRFLNHPVRTLRRFDLLRQLERRGFNPFRAVRASDDLTGLRYPVFIRGDRSHDGAVSPLLRSAREVEAAIGRALVAGRRIEDLLVVEFCDTADTRGYYRKYGAFIVGESIIPRRLDHGRAWMLKRECSEFSAALGLEELEYVRANPHAEALREIIDLAAVGYGCIDYAVKDGRIVVWEINLAPRMGPGRGDVRVPKTPEYGRIHKQTGRVYHPRLQAAFEALDVPASAPAVTVEIDPGIVRAARAGVNGIPAGSGRLVRLLRSARPVLEPVAARVLPLVGRVARRRAGGTP
ncbi:MAG TPA: hypothetical protein VFS53_00845 [Gemmatimonadota bacterium]|nr:hypothetical protein [Gemmatimonadota bacterium]